MMAWKKVFVIFVVLPGIPFILGLLGIVTITFFPGNYSAFSPAYPDVLAYSSTDSIQIEVFIHGKDSNAKQMADMLSLNERLADSPNKVRVFPDWSVWAKSFLRVSSNGLELGKIYGKQLAKLPPQSSVHLISHSAGAFFAYGVCKSLKNNNVAIKVQTTFLAPLWIKNLFQRDFGVYNFGTCGDFSDSYFDKLDSVPGANKPLPNAFSFDLTEIRETCRLTSCPPHIAPVNLYGYALSNNQVPLLSLGDATVKTFPKGGEVVIRSSDINWRKQ